MLRAHLVVLLAVSFTALKGRAAPPKLDHPQHTHVLGSPSSPNKQKLSEILVLKEKLSTVLQQSDLVGMIQQQAEQNKQAVAHLERTMHERTHSLGVSVQELARTVSAAQRNRTARTVDQARRLQQLLDQRDLHLRQMLSPSATWMVRARRVGCCVSCVRSLVRLQCGTDRPTDLFVSFLLASSQVIRFTSDCAFALAFTAVCCVRWSLRYILLL